MTTKNVDNWNNDSGMKFKTEKDMKACAKYYQKILGLSDWKIVVRYADDDELDKLSKDAAGYCQSVNTIKCAEILIGHNTPSHYFKQPEELILIHELLHCVFTVLYNAPVNMTICEESFYQDQHMILNDMAESIYMAKHGIDSKEWFCK